MPYVHSCIQVFPFICHLSVCLNARTSLNDLLKADFCCKWYTLTTFIYFFFIAGWANHGDGPKSPALPVGLHPEYHQRGTLSHSHITQVLHHLLIFSDGFALNHLRCSQNISLFTRESRSTKLSVMKERKNDDDYYNWLELHFSWKVLFPGWQLILASRNTQASIKLSWSMRAYWLTGAFFFFLHEKTNCQYQCWSLFIIQDYLEQS